MAVIAVVGWFAIALALIALSVSLLVTLGEFGLKSLQEIAKDGLKAGARAPRWTLLDDRGVERRMPDGRWRVLLFADHSLLDYPEVAQALASVAQNDEAEVAVAAQRADLVPAVLEALDAPAPVLKVDARFYADHRVRVMPYLTVIDPAGIVRWSGLVNTGPQVRTAVRLARVSDLGRTGAS